MDDKKILFPLLLFGIFFVLIAITGFFQIAITKRNMEGLLRGEGETLFKSIAREIEVNMEYLTLIEKSPSIITPNFLNVTTYDEAIVDDLYSQLTKPTGPGRTPYLSTTSLSRTGRERSCERKGSIKVDKAHLDLLLKKDRQTVIRLPSNENQSSFHGDKACRQARLFRR